MQRRHYWERPEVIKENKLDPRNLALPFGEDDDFCFDDSPYKLSLNGKWRFFWKMGVAGTLWIGKGLVLEKISWIQFAVCVCVCVFRLAVSVSG